MNDLDSKQDDSSRELVAFRIGDRITVWKL